MSSVLKRQNGLGRFRSFGSWSPGQKQTVGARAWSRQLGGRVWRVRDGLELSGARAVRGCQPPEENQWHGWPALHAGHKDRGSWGWKFGERHWDMH